MNDPIFTTLFSPLMHLGPAPFSDWFESIRWALIICAGSYVAILSVRWLASTFRTVMARQTPGYRTARANLIMEIEKPLRSSRVYAQDPIIESGRGADRGVPPPCGHPIVSLMDTDGTRLFHHHGCLERSPFEDRLCPACTEAFVEVHSTQCAECERSIFPTEPVANSWVDASRPYTHLRCALDIDLYCGLWGKGEFISLHCLEPAQYPPGTRNLKTHQTYILQSRRRTSSM